MKKNCFLAIVLFLSFGFVSSQYYYYDSGTTTYPYQQGCTEQIFVKVNTQGLGARAGRFHVVLDPLKISYSTSDLVSVLRSDLFLASSIFSDWSSESSPSWKAGSNKTILQIDRKNNLINFQGDGLYGTFYFVPRFFSSLYSVAFGMEYIPGSSTIETTLSAPGGVEIINSPSQISKMTGSYQILQQPCVDDTNAPSIGFAGIASTKQSSLSGFSLSLNEAGGVNGSNVPYVFTGGGIWTGNPAGVISNQYGIDFSTFTLTVSGNGEVRSFTPGMFSDVVGSNLLYTVSGKTWQYNPLNYGLFVAGNQLQDFGIEKQIVISAQVRDRKGYLATNSVSFNALVRPWGMGSFSPAGGAQFVQLGAPVKLGIQDDWAGVDSGSIVVTLQGINGTVYGPYQFSGSDLNLSGVQGSADQPDWYVNISDHPHFPASGTIRVSVYAQDMEGNIDSINDYSFTTRPNCSDLQCCDDKYIEYGTSVVLYPYGEVFISGGNNPYLSWTGSDSTGYLYCGLENDGLYVYKGDEVHSGSAELKGVLGNMEFSLWGNDINAVLSGATMYLSKIFTHGILSEPRGFGGGSVSLRKDSCPDGDYSDSYYDATCGQQGGVHGAVEYCSVKDSPYSDEYNNAFQYSYALGMTTQCPIETANLTGYIKRKHLAKMMVEYAVKIIGVYPDIKKVGCDRYDDMEYESEEMKFYIKTVCQLGLMGFEADGVTPLKTFDVDGYLTRGEFGTILSRLIFGDVYNVKNFKKGQNFYDKHLEALYKYRVMKYPDPLLLEQRVYIMIMFKRIHEGGLVDKFRPSIAASNGIQILSGH